ncbi:MAG TPA: ATP-grasp domain-containing protein [Bryobacteraceae bacterium]
MKRRVLLVASKTGYQVSEFRGAAERLDVDLVLATDRCHVLDDPWGDHAIALRFEAPLEEIEALEARGPFDGILAVGDGPALVAARCAERLGLRFHSSGAVNAANDKRRTRERFRGAGLNVPDFRIANRGDDSEGQWFPCVLKPLRSSASRGVIRANSPAEFAAALARIHKITGDDTALVEDFIPGREFALEGIVTEGKLHTLAIFDKPDPLDGPFFEETIYLAPSREPAPIQGAIREATQQAVTALGLDFGSVHAEMRVNDGGVWMLEAAARPIGGLCSRVLRFGSGMGLEMTLEEVLLRHALGEDVVEAKLAPGAHGVMMIPIPSAGIYSGVEGLEPARETADIEAIEITAKEGHRLEPLPEGASYLGFLFARAPDAESVERAMRRAHACLRFNIVPALSVIK